MHLEKQRATHDTLKRLKFELQPLLNQQTSSATATVESVSCQQDASSNGATKSFETNALVEYHAKFVLPDLNIPLAEEVVPHPDVICLHHLEDESNLASLETNTSVYVFLSL